MVTLLLAVGADVNAADGHGQTPILAAIQECRYEAVQLLLAAGANMTAASTDGFTPLHAAAAQGDHRVVQLLLQRGVDPQQRNTHGLTAVHTAACFGWKDTVQLLLEAWGQPIFPVVDLVQAAKAAADKEHEKVVARLAKELQSLYPEDFYQLFEGETPVLTQSVVAAILQEWTLDVSGLDKERAAVCKREKDLESQKRGVQQLIVGMAGMAKLAQQG
jgi:hypothetical protein